MTTKKVDIALLRQYTRALLDSKAMLRDLAQRSNEGKKSMKKLALTVTVLATLGLAACGGGAEEADTNATNVEVTTENAVEDVTAAENAANVADNAVENAVDNAAESATNAM